LVIGLADLGRTDAEPGDRLGRRARRRPVGDPQGEQVAADPRLELVAGALGDHPAEVDHGDAVGQPVGLLQVLVVSSRVVPSSTSSLMTS
jgi:hypothetical protein